MGKINKKILNFFKLFLQESLMSRLNFDSSGNLSQIEGISVEKQISLKKEKKKDPNLKKSNSLEFLHDSSPKLISEDIFQKTYWNLYSNDKEIGPLKFSNNKTQEDGALTGGRNYFV